MDRALNEFNRARNRMTGDFHSIITDSEDLLKAAAAVSDESFSAARRKFEDKLRHAKTALAEASQPVFDRSMETAAVADDYVRGNPWTAIGAATVAGLLFGFLAAKR